MATLAEYFFRKQKEKGLIFSEEKRKDAILVKNGSIKGRRKEKKPIQEDCNEWQWGKHKSKDL